MRVIHPLDGQWLLITDPGNRGAAEGWFAHPQPAAQPAAVPGAIEEIFPGYDGVVWYWHAFVPPALPEEAAWAALRFWAADYYAEVWLNGHYVGSHEGGETPFRAEVGGTILPQAENLLAVRLVHAAVDSIDGFDLAHVPHGIKRVPFRPGAGHNYGGIWQPVELLALPAAYVTDVFVQPHLATGEIAVEVTLTNSSDHPLDGILELVVTSPDGGGPVVLDRRPVPLPKGEMAYHAALSVPNVRPWTLDRPALYHLTARLEAPGASPDYLNTRFGFREFTFHDGYFRLNGERMILKGTHTVGHYPIGLVLPRGPEMLRQELLNLKMMGITCCRSLGRMLFPQQLDFCDELGLLVYQETLAAWNWQNSPQMAQRFDASVHEMIRRDRNHPSVVIWGLLNETSEGEIFRHAAGMLPHIRVLDPTRMVLLNSGHWDALDIDTMGTLNTGHYEEVEAILQGTRTATGMAALPYQATWSSGFADYHRYVLRPLEEEAITTFRRLGTPEYKLFQSEFGNGSALDPVRITRLFEQNGARNDLDDGVLYQRMAERLEHDFHQLGLEEVFATPSDLVRASETLHAENRALGIAALRANPNLCGYSMTGMLDHTMVGEGLMTIFREPKQATIDALRDAWQPLQWSLFTDQTSVYRGQSLRVQAVLVNEDQLRPGTYPVRLRVTGPGGVLFEKAGNVVIPAATGGHEASLVFAVFDEQIALNGPPGRYEVRALFDRGGAAIGRAHVYVSDPPTPLTAEVTVWDTGSALGEWFRSHGLIVRPFEPMSLGSRKSVVLVNAPSVEDRQTAFRPLLDWIASGGIAVFLSPHAFGLDEESVHGVFYKGRLAWCPFGADVGVKQARGCWWAVDHVVKDRPIVAGLLTGRLMDMHYHRLLHPRWTYVGLNEGDVAIAGLGIGTCGEEDNYWAGADLTTLPWGEGRVILSTLLIAENVGRDPVADRLALNLALLSAPR